MVPRQACQQRQACLWRRKESDGKDAQGLCAWLPMDSYNYIVSHPFPDRSIHSADSMRRLFLLNHPELM